jgi:hypothetical protein
LQDCTQLTEVEEAFKNLKGDLGIRPIIHQLLHRIEARVHRLSDLLSSCHSALALASLELSKTLARKESREASLNPNHSMFFVQWMRIASCVRGQHPSRSVPMWSPVETCMTNILGTVKVNCELRGPPFVTLVASSDLETLRCNLCRVKPLFDPRLDRGCSLFAFMHAV